MPSLMPVPDNSLLGAYARKGAFTDCYAMSVSAPITLSEFIEAFYTTRLFKLERWLLTKTLNVPSTDEQVVQLSLSRAKQFSIWQVENRLGYEILLDAGQTRSWLCVRPQAGTTPSTTLLFGTAVVPVRPDGKFGLLFHMFGGFHRLYSKLLLSAASKRLVVLREAQGAV